MKFTSGLIGIIQNNGYNATAFYFCFNHIVGLPIKDEVGHPIYDYEKILFDNLMTYHSRFIRQTSMGKEGHWIRSY